VLLEGYVEYLLVLELGLSGLGVARLLEVAQLE